MDVESLTGDRLGELDGFVVDSASGRPYYLAVDSGGWFKSKFFLLPVGHAQLDREREVIVADLTRDRVERFPGFDKDVFQKFGEEELGRFNDETYRAINVSGAAPLHSGTSVWDSPDFRRPDWWESTVAPLAAKPLTGTRRDEERTRVTEAEPSPYPGGRAQPGDVIGLETGGERTYVGDTTEDENKRRREAEDEAARSRN